MKIANLVPFVAFGLVGAQEPQYKNAEFLDMGIPMSLPYLDTTALLGEKKVAKIDYFASKLKATAPPDACGLKRGLQAEEENAVFTCEQICIMDGGICWDAAQITIDSDLETCVCWFDAAGVDTSVLTQVSFADSTLPPGCIISGTDIGINIYGNDVGCQNLPMQNSEVTRACACKGTSNTKHFQANFG